MITRFLLRFGLVLVDLAPVARALAADVMRTHDVDVLDTYGTQRALRRRYALWATQTGLPIAAQRKVAEMAWTYIVAAQDKPPQAQSHKEFSFYA